MPIATGFSVWWQLRETGCEPAVLVTEHGIYTNERRIELAWPIGCSISGAGGYVTRNRSNCGFDLVECISCFSAG